MGCTTVWDFEVVSALLFLSFVIWCQLFVCMIKAATDFSFATSICGLVFLCHRHLCAVSFFHGLFCRRHSC